MPAPLRPGLRCPTCNKRVLLVYHDWRGAEDVALFEYHHEDDPQREREGLAPAPCEVLYPYGEGLARAEAETA